MLFHLMYWGAAYADALQYQRCIILYGYALKMRVAKDLILFNDTCMLHGVEVLVCLYLNLYEQCTGNQKTSRVPS
jgi:hypothetical protein